MVAGKTVRRLFDNGSDSLIIWLLIDLNVSLDAHASENKSIRSNIVDRQNAGK